MDEFKQQFMARARAGEWSLPDALGIPAQGQRARSLSPPPLASRPLPPVSLRGSRSVIRAPGLRWHLVTRETRRERLAVALGTSPRPWCAVHDSRLRALCLRRAWRLALGLSERHLSPAAKKGASRPGLVSFTFTLGVINKR